MNGATERYSAEPEGRGNPTERSEGGRISEAKPRVGCEAALVLRAFFKRRRRKVRIEEEGFAFLFFWLHLSKKRWKPCRRQGGCEAPLFGQLFKAAIESTNTRRGFGGGSLPQVELRSTGSEEKGGGEAI